MGEQKLQYDENEELTPESQQLLDERAREVIAGIQGTDDEMYDRIADKLSEQDDTRFSPEIIQELFLHDLNSEDRLKFQQKNTIAFAEALCRNINSALLGKKVNETDIKINSTSPAIDKFISHLSTSSAIEKNLLLPILEALNQDIKAFDSAEKTSALAQSHTEISDKINLARSIRQKVSKLPVSHQQQEYLAQAEKFVEKFEELNDKLKSAETNDFQAQFKELENSYLQIFQQVESKNNSYIGFSSSNSNKNPTKATADFSGFLTKLANDKTDVDKKYNELRTELLKQPFTPSQKTSIGTLLDAIFNNVKNCVDELGKIVPSTPTMDVTMVHQLASDISNVLNSFGGTTRKTALKDHFEQLRKIKPLAAGRFAKASLYGNFAQLSDELAEFNDQLFGKTVSPKGPSFEQIRKASKTVGENIDTRLETLKKLQAESETVAIKTDDKIREEKYREYLFKNLTIGKQVAHKIEFVGREVRGLAKANNIDYDEKLDDKNADLGEKLEIIIKLIEKLGGSEKLNPKTRKLLSEIQNTPDSPLEQFKKLKEKSDRIEQLKIELINTKNSDVLDPKVATLHEELKQALIELRDLEIQYLGAKEAAKMRKEINTERKTVSDSIEFVNGEVKAKIGSKLSTHLNIIDGKINSTWATLKSIEKNIDTAPNEAKRAEYREQYRTLHAYLTSLEELREQKQREMDQYFISNPEKITSFNDKATYNKIRGHIWKREHDKFQVHSGYKRKFFSETIKGKARWRNFWLSGPRATHLWREARHLTELHRLYNQELRLMLDTGYQPKENFYGVIQGITHGPIRYFLHRAINTRQERVREHRTALDEWNQKWLERDQKNLEKLKAKYPQLANESNIWNSRNVQKAIRIGEQIARLAESNPDDPQIAILQKRITDELKDAQEANKALQKLLAPTFKGDIDAEAKTKEITSEKEFQEKISEKRLTELFEKFTSTKYAEKYYPDGSTRFEKEKDQWRIVANYPHIPDNLSEHTLKPFFQFIKLHLPSSNYILKPKDILILLKLQNLNISNMQRCTLTSASDFFKDFEKVKELTKTEPPDKRVVTVRNYLDYRQEHPIAMRK